MKKYSKTYKIYIPNIYIYLLSLFFFFKGEEGDRACFGKSEGFLHIVLQELEKALYTSKADGGR